jgi:N utilization substance protein B
MQSLFEWDFNGSEVKVLPSIVSRNVAEFAPGLEDSNFIDNLVSGVIDQQEKLDLIIEKAAPEWPISQIAIVDRNVLRLGLYELLFADHKQVPARVAINEAIELAKTFGGETSGRFVNGVLGAVYKEMGEPDKDEVPAKKRRPKDVPYEEMPVEKLCGAVVYCRENNEIKLAFVHDIFGYWTLSKGHVEQNESVKEGCVREIKEELGMQIKVGQELGANEYIASDPEKGKIRKQVNYFLAEAQNPERLKLAEGKGGLDEVRWFPLQEIADLRMYDDVVVFITKAIKILNK